MILCIFISKNKQITYSLQAEPEMDKTRGAQEDRAPEFYRVRALQSHENCTKWQVLQIGVLGIFSRCIGDMLAPKTCGMPNSFTMYFQYRVSRYSLVGAGLPM